MSEKKSPCTCIPATSGSGTGCRGHADLHALAGDRLRGTRQLSLPGIQPGGTVHNTVGLTWLIAFAFFVFWLFTTGEWKQYIPTTKKMFRGPLLQLRHLQGRPTRCPSARMPSTTPSSGSTYLSLAAFLLPVQMISGFLYWGYNSWNAWGLGWLIAGASSPCCTRWGRSPS
jgi:hypothetical protein